MNQADKFDGEIIPVAEERLVVSKRSVETGRVRVELRTDIREETPDVELRREIVSVERIPLGRIVTAVPETREVDGVTIIPVVEEVIVKHLVLREEIHIRRTVSLARPNKAETLRRQTATVTREPSQS